jgi:hypothetical protein
MMLFNFHFLSVIPISSIISAKLGCKSFICMSLITWSLKLTHIHWFIFESVIQTIWEFALIKLNFDILRQVSPTSRWLARNFSPVALEPRRNLVVLTIIAHNWNLIIVVMVKEDLSVNVGGPSSVGCIRFSDRHFSNRFLLISVCRNGFPFILEGI